MAARRAHGLPVLTRAVTALRRLFRGGGRGLPPHGLAMRVALPLLGGVTVFALTLAIGVNVYKRQALRRVEQERAAWVASLVQNAIDCRRPEHLADLARLVQGLVRGPDIAAVRVLAPEGRVVVSTPAASSPASQDTLLRSLHPIANGEQCQSCHRAGPITGFVEVNLRVTRQIRGLETWEIMSASTYGAQVVALGLLVAVVLGAAVVRPIRTVVRGMQAVRAGDLSVKLDPVGTTELDLLVDGFNAMTGRLRDAARAEQEARAWQLERAEQLAVVGQLAAGLAHEIRNPLAGVVAAVEVLSGDFPEQDPKRLVLLESARELGRIDRIIRSLLEYARPGTPVRAPTDLGQIVQNALTLLRIQASSQQVEVAVVPADGPVVVSVDPGMIRQVIINLVLNAVDAVNGRPGPRVEVTIVRQEDGTVLCRVRDSGPGVPAAKAADIFRPFHTTKARGTGLGLAISRRLIELHGADLRLENPGEPGASFVFVLPEVGPGSPAEAHA